MTVADEGLLELEPSSNSKQKHIKLIIHSALFICTIVLMPYNVSSSVL